MHRKRLIAANWKMNPLPPGALEMSSVYRSRDNIEVIVFAAFTDVHACIAAGLRCGGQWGHPEDAGACTGDVSMAMLKQAGCEAVLCGHSERRQHHQETDAFVAKQVASAVRHGLTPILCIGETFDQRELGQTEEVLQRQLRAVTLTKEIVIAYEPVWAISGGDAKKPAASAADAQAMHAFIRSCLPASMRLSTRILYGGSMKPENAQELLAQPDIDGGLVGAASLDTKGFGKIVEST